MESYSGHIRLKGMSIEHGLCSIIAAYCYDMGRACRTKGILHAMGYAGIVAEQDAGEERRLWFGHAERLRDDAR